MTTGQINIWRGWVRRAYLAALRERLPLSDIHNRYEFFKR